MKRLLVLLLTLAITVSLASVTLAVYQRTMAVPDISIGNKVFDVFAQPAYSVTEPRPAVNVPEWHFTIFNNVTNPDPSDLSITVTLNTSSTSGLVVDVLNGSGDVIGSAQFNGNSSATITFSGYIAASSTIRDNLRLRFSYNGLLLSPTNNPFGGTTAQYSVTVFAEPQEDLIEKVRNNRWLRLEIRPTQGQGGNRLEFFPTLSDRPDTPSGVAAMTTTPVTVIYSPASSVFEVRVGSGPSFVFSNVDPDTITPTGILFYGENLTDKTMTISNVNLNGTSVPDTFVFDSAQDAHLFTDFTPNADGGFTITFDVTRETGGYSNPYFAFYLGYI